MNNDEAQKIIADLLATPFFTKITRKLSNRAAKFVENVNLHIDKSALEDPLTLFLAVGDVKSEYLELLEVSQYIRGILFHEADKKEGTIEI